MLFADLVGFTSVSESRDAEDVRELLSRYFDGARTVVGRYGGTIEKFIGDAVMAVWGVPTAHGDDAERAVRAGLDLVDMVRSIGDSAGVAGLNARVGLVTGEVAVTLGAVGQGMVAGDAVNTASRVQSAAPPGQVWVDDTTRSMTAAAIDYTDAGQHELKGKSQPMRLFAVRTVSGSVGGASRMDGLEAACLGRDREIRLLRELFHATEESGRPSLVIVEGEAGVGKTRLAWEFFKYVDGLSRNVMWHQGRCLSYGEGVSFWALAAAIRVRLDLAEPDTAQTVADHLAESLTTLVPDEEERVWLQSRLSVLLGLDTRAEYQREDLFSAWATFLQRVGSGDPVVLVLDDAQYADEGLLDFLDHLLATASFGIYVLVLTRPGLVAARPKLATTARSTVLHLERLPDAVMAGLLDALVDELPNEVRTSLVERSGGVPLFAVETVRALIDRDLVVPRGGRYVLADPSSADLTGLSAPASLQALVAARLDALTAAERAVVSAASVLGLVFPRSGIEVLAGEVAELDDVLRSLVRKQILGVETERFSSERGSYRFMQPVVRQVAYDTLSRRDRKARHLRVADHLLAEHDGTDENTPIVAQHLLDALDASGPDDEDRQVLQGRASSLLERAAARANGLGSPSDAAHFLDAAIGLAADEADAARLSTIAAEAAFLCEDLAGAQAHASRALAWFESQDDLLSAADAAGWVARVDHSSGRSSAALELLMRYWSRLADDPRPLAVIGSLARMIGTTHLFAGRPTEALPYLDRAHHIAEQSGNDREVSRMLNTLTTFYQMTGAPRVSEALATQSALLAERMDAPHELANAFSIRGMIRLHRSPPEAVDLLRQALANAHRSGSANMTFVASINLASALALAGVWDEITKLLAALPASTLPANRAFVRAQQLWLAVARGEDALPDDPTAADAAQSEVEQDLSSIWQLHMLTKWITGDLDDAVDAAERAVDHVLAASGVADDFIVVWPRALDLAIEAGRLDAADRLLALVAELPPGLLSPMLAALLARFRGLIALSRGETGPETEMDHRAAITAFEESGAIPWRGRTQEALGRLLLAEGRADEAVELLSAARSTYQDLGAGAWLAAMADLPVGTVAAPATASARAPA